MIRSKIFLNAMLIVVTAILFYTFLLSFFIVPKVENIIKNIEEKHAKETLDKIIIIVNNVNYDLENFRKFSLSQHKKSLINLTDSIWSILDSEYKKSEHDNISIVLKQNALEFKKNLLSFYLKNKGVKFEIIIPIISKN